MAYIDPADLAARRAEEAKRGTEHEDHFGWTFPHDHFGLYCGCGASIWPAGSLFISPAMSSRLVPVAESLGVA